MATRCTPTTAYAIIATIAVAATLAACGSGASSGGELDPSGRGGEADDVRRANSAAQSAPPATMTARQVEAEVLKRYRRYQRIYERAYGRNDPSELETVAMDPLLSEVTKNIEKAKGEGEIWRFTNVLNPKIQGRAKDNSVVVVLDCVRTLGAYRFEAETGKRIGSHEGSSYLYQVVLRYADGTWKVSEAKQGQKC